MRFQPAKGNMMQLTRNLTNEIQASHNLEGTVLGVTITNNLRWNTYISNNSLKLKKQQPWILEANSSLLPKDVKENSS